MDFPFKPQHVVHRLGGKIVVVHGLRHQVNKPRDGRSLDAWWYVGDVEWFDGTKSTNHQIDPPMLCFDGERKDWDALSDAMMDYLREHGEWRRSKPEGWYAHDRKVSRAA